MSAVLHTHHRSFGAPSADADTLVIELLPDSIGFCEFNADLGQPLYATHADIEQNSPVPLKEQVVSAVKHFRFLQKNYRTVYINFFTGRFTLCPAAFYEDEHKRQILEFNTGHSGDDIVLCDDINQEIKLVYAMDEQLKSALDLLFPNHHMKHSLTVLSQLMLHSEDLHKSTVLVQLHQSCLALLVKQGGKLVLVNQFQVSSTEDILYYILFALEQFQLDPAIVDLSLTGNTEADSEPLAALRKYIRNVRLGTGSRAIRWDNLPGMPQHFNYSLINRIFCES